ncbi:MAG: ATP-dependent helicase [Proteobacteria bacterium]|nr:ATP-dependent helicase [Pseudomonadota bacterium]
MTLDLKGGWAFAQNIANLLNKINESNIDEYKLLQSKSTKLRIIAEICRVYGLLLADANAIDFSSIQTKMLHLLENEEVLETLRDKFEYIFVDEYQDTNRIQEDILLKLAAPKNKVCVVGDDDQALYRFRGATVENILRFREKFPKKRLRFNGNLTKHYRYTCQKVELTKNYRSHPDIIDFYNRWMEQFADQHYRYPKTIENAGPQTKENTKYPGVIRVMGNDMESWADSFIDFVDSLKENNILSDYNQICILARSVKNDKVAALAQTLEDNGIPVFSPRADLFFERPEIRNIIGAFGFLFPNLIESILKNDYTENHEKYYQEYWDYYQTCINQFAGQLRSNSKKHKSLRIWAASKAKELASLTENTNYAFSDIFYELLQFPMFSEYFETDGVSIKDLRPQYNLALFSRLIAKYEYLYKIIVFKPEQIHKDVAIFFNTYLKFLIEGGSNEYEDFDMVTPSGCISFMTIHQSKGLEFPITCVASLDASPRKQFDWLDEELQQFYYQSESYEPIDKVKYFDFWRLFYTAFSRAKNLLVLTGIDNETTRLPREHKSPSKYFLPIYEDVPDWDVLFTSEDNHPILDKVQPSNIKHTYSFTSHILVYENCPIQYQFFRELEFTPKRTNQVMFGTLVHQTIEDVHRAVLAERIADVTPENIKSWLNTNYIQLNKITGLYLDKRSLESIEGHVNRYVQRASRDWTAMREAEVPVSLQKENYILEGKIDLIRGKGDTVEILDFKSEKKPDVNDEADRERLRRYRRQLEIYAHIIEQKYDLRVSRMHLYYTSVEEGDPRISYPYNQHSIDRTIDEVSAIVDKIENKEFTQDPAKRCAHLCDKCDLKHFCNR